MLISARTLRLLAAEEKQSHYVFFDAHRKFSTQAKTFHFIVAVENLFGCENLCAPLQQVNRAKMNFEQCEFDIVLAFGNCCVTGCD